MGGMSEENRQAAAARMKAMHEAKKAEEPEMLTIQLTRSYNTNGNILEAGRHTLPKELAEDLLEREARYAKYREGISEKHHIMGTPGVLAAGGVE